MQFGLDIHELEILVNTNNKGWHFENIKKYIFAWKYHDTMVIYIVDIIISLIFSCQPCTVAKTLGCNTNMFRYRSNMRSYYDNLVTKATCSNGQHRLKELKCSHNFFDSPALRYLDKFVHCFHGKLYNIAISGHPTQSNPIQSMDESNPCPTLR